MPRATDFQPDMSMLEPVADTMSPPPSAPAFPDFPGMNAPHRGVIAPGQGTSTDQLRQFYRGGRGGIPQHRITPLPTTASASINAAAQSVAVTVSETIVNNAIAALPPAGGAIDGTVSAPHIPYTSGADTLSDSTFTFTPTGNVLGNASSSSEISLIGAGGNEIDLGMNTGGSFPTFLSITDSVNDSLFLGVRPSTHEAIFTISDGAGDGVTFDATNGGGMNTQWVAASLSDNIILDARTNSELFQMESGLNGLALWSLDTDGSSDFEQVDHAGSFFEIFQDGTRASFLSLADNTGNNNFQVDVNKTAVGTVAVTLKSPKPSIDMGGGGPTITAGSGAPTGSAVNGSLYMRSGGTHAGLSLLYVYDAATTAWIGIA